ncbi:MAG: Tad domain-containing protein, partial [Sphingomonadales bacterium]|nr:Tad domain-containing protein [Sphingomonadales bacterium]
MREIVKNLFSFAKRLSADKNGGVIIYTAILLPTLVGFVGMGVDVALWHVTKRQTQAMADAAALSGSLEILRVETSPDVQGSAMAEAVKNGFVVGTSDQIT